MFIDARVARWASTSKSDFSRDAPGGLEGSRDLDRPIPTETDRGGRGER